MTKKTICILILFFTTWFNTQAQSFVAQVSKNKVAVNEVFQIAFTVEGAGGTLTLPNLSDFNIYSGPNQSQSQSYVNGNFSQSTSISYFIAGKKPGRFIIGASSVTTANGKLETKPIVIDVVKEATQPQQQNASNNSQQASSNASQKSKDVSSVTGEELFVRTLLSKNSCFLGEQIILTQKVYSKVDLRGFQNVKFPQYNGFWSKGEENNKQVSLQQENINGVMYYVAEYHKMFLFPQRSGQLTVDPVELECIVRKAVKRQPRNIFEQFFGSGGYEDVVVKVKSKLVKVDVKELPTENKPENFTGAVGNFTYKVDVNKKTVKANDAFNLKLTINGKGNINLIDPVKLNLHESFEVYDPKITEKINTNGGVSGSKTYDYLIIPREKGEFIINNLTFNFFDTDKKQYVNLPSPDINLTVLEGDAGSAKIISPAKKGTKTDNELESNIKGDLELQQTETEFFASITHYLCLILPALVFIIGLLLTKHYTKINSDTIAIKEKKAAKIAKQQLTIAQKQIATNNKEVFFNELLKALHHYLGNKFGLVTTDLSKQKISEILLSKNVNEVVTNKTIETLNTCEYAKYAQITINDDLKVVYNNAVNLIADIEEQIKK